jgi:hypothetical protein
MIYNVCALKPDYNPPRYDVIWWEDVKIFWKTKRVIKAKQFMSYKEAMEFYKMMKEKENQK